MNRLRRCGVLVVTTAAAILAACSTIPVDVQFDPAADVPAYRTFTCLPGLHYGAADASVVQEAREAIEAELGRKGFIASEDAGAADFVVDFRLGTEDRVEVHTSPPPYEGHWWSMEDWWGHPDWAYVTDVRRYREGALVIDIFDAHTHARIWHGWTKKKLNSAGRRAFPQPHRGFCSLHHQTLPAADLSTSAY